MNPQSSAEMLPLDCYQSLKPDNSIYALSLHDLSDIFQSAMMKDTDHTTGAEVLEGCPIWPLPCAVPTREAWTLLHELHGRSMHVAVARVTSTTLQRSTVQHVRSSAAVLQEDLTLYRVTFGCLGRIVLPTEAL